jgi:hypothetical protein
MSALRLRESPDWIGAAEALIAASSGLGDDDERVRWLEHSCAALGDALYPAFLRVLCLVGEHGEDAARRNVASTLLHALQSGRLPAGRHAAWGAQRMSVTCLHGPLEYLCAWYLHPPGGEVLSAPAFDRAARSLLVLLASDAHAHRLYRARLAAAADDPIEGAWSRTDREALRALVRTWVPGSDPDLAVSAFLRSGRGAPEPAWPGGLRAL